MKKIRVGLIRCDLHGIYYAALFEKHDPLMLARNDLYREGGKRHGWQTGGAHFYFYTYWADPTRMTAPRVNGLSLVKLWDEDREVAEIAAELFHGKPKVCDRFEEVSDDVDLVFVADCDTDGFDHLKLATPGLKKGVPTFVDKPFAHDVKDAVAMVNLAKKRRTAVLSLSILRTVPHLTQFRKRFGEVGEVHYGIVKQSGTRLAAAIHAISTAQHVFGDGVEAVWCMGAEPHATMHLDYGGKADRPCRGVMLNCVSGPGPHGACYVSAYGPGGAIHSQGVGDFEFPWGAAKNLELARKMARTGKPPVPYEEMIENIAVAAAARRSQKLGKAVRISDCR